MAIKEDGTKAASKNLLDWLSTIGGIAAILFDFLSLILDAKPAKQFAFGLAIIFPLGVFWYQRQKKQDIKIPATGKQDTASAANRLLKSYLAVYEQDGGSRIPISRVRWIQKFASIKLRSERKAAELIRASELAFYWILATNIFVGIVLTATLYAFLTTNYAFNPIDYLFGRDTVKKENPFIFLEKGSGTMIFGSDTPDPGGEQKTQTVPIGDFSIQQTEVTNQQYHSCRSAGGCSSDPEVPKFYKDKTYDNHPVVYVNAFQAIEFCRWMGGGLPSSEQWERAARGLYGQLWPSWNGEIYPSNLAHLWAPGVTGFVEVTKFPSDNTSNNVMGLVGNVSEWTNSQLVKNGESDLSVPWDGKDVQAKVIVRGGSWTYTPTRITQVQYRGPDKGSDSIGFRCVIPMN